MKSDLLAFLQATNPWLIDPAARHDSVRDQLPAKFVGRSVDEALSRALEDTRHAVVVIGPRQVGKSTLVWSRLATERPLLHVNAEESLVREWCRSPALFAADARPVLPRGGILFVEEAQWLEEAGLFIKGLVDLKLGWTIVVTGSASFHLAARTRESLAGRARRFHVWPLDLAEVVPADPSGEFATLARRRPALARLLRHGGYPEAWTSEQPAAILRGLVEALVLRDASDRFRIARPDAFRRLLQLMAGQIGDLVNASEWASLLSISAPTVSEYAALLEETHIVRLIRPFIGGKRSELTSMPKVYFVDVGLRNALSGGFEPIDGRADTGKLLENWVFSTLQARFPEPGGVRYWRTKSGAEVDFVVEPTPGTLVAIEVKAGAARGVSRGARSFIEAYAPRELWLVHGGEAAESQIGQTRVRMLEHVRLPEAVDELVPR